MTLATFVPPGNLWSMQQLPTHRSLTLTRPKAPSAHCKRRQTSSASRQANTSQHHLSARMQASTSPTAAAQEPQNLSTLPLLVGLTGSIGMGKSTVSGFLTALGVPVLCADDVVHKLYAVGGAAVAPVGAAFPDAVVDGAVDRVQLSKYVVGNEAAMKQLEGIVHPLVEQERLQFIQQHAAAGAPVVVFDIPLLYETKAEQQLDVVLVVSAPADVQQQRVLARPGMTPEKLAAILARQVPDQEKRRRADYVIDTGCSLQKTEQEMSSVMAQLKGRQGSAAAKLLQQKQ